MGNQGSDKSMSTENEIARVDKAEDKGGEQQTAEAKGSNLNLVDIAGHERDICTEDTDVKQLSKVGPYLSVITNVDTYCTGAAHPGNSHDYKTIHTGSAQDVVITDLFKKEDVYNAMMHDKLVAKALDSANEHPRNFEELRAVLLKDDGLGITYFEEDENKPPYRLDDQMLSEFAFHHLEDNNVAVRMKLDTVGGADRNVIQELGLLLPIPDELRKDLKAADSLKGGFLMKNSDSKGQVFSKHVEYPADF
jgi:hypothetical protein